MKKHMTNPVLGALVLLIWIIAAKRFINFSKDTPAKEVKHSKTESAPITLDLKRLEFVYNQSIRNPFLKSSPPKKIQKPHIQEPKKKPLKNPYINTKLEGVLINGNESVAILSQGKHEYYLRLSDSLNGGILSAVYTDSVIFKVENAKWVVGM